MSLSGYGSQATTALPLPFNSSTWGERRTSTESEQEYPGNKTHLLSDLHVLGHDDKCHMSPVLTACLIVLYSVALVLGLLGNIGLICIIARHREKVNVTNLFICNLSFSDILVCVFCLPFTVVYTLMDYWVFGSLLCQVVPFLQCVSVTVSVLSLVFIALERHQLIINPSGWRPSILQAYMALALIWILACLTSSPFLAFQVLTNEPYTNLMSDLPQSQAYPNASPPLPVPNIYKNTSVYPEPHGTLFSYTPSSPHMEACMEHWPSQRHMLAYTTWLLLFQYFAPLLLVLLCYVRVFVHLRHRKDMLDRARTPESQRMSHSCRISIMLVALITAFALCWMPLTIFNIVSDWNREALPICHHNLLFSLCHLLAMSSTCINPVVYGFLNSNFREEVRDVILHCRCSPLEECEHIPISTVRMEVSRASVPVNCKRCSV
ncbi:neuropeptide Y receptor type 4-2-like [Brachionichthys hirsutus]|uniref:neuropeptide Y receptor type 4-2-like n=1 Tax=Brachionichthys hirsutus TaxID=412623 RepID=UPI00360437A9